MLLLATNIWLELLLDQERSDEVRRLIDDNDPADLAISEFTLYSIAVILGRNRRYDLFDDFLSDVLVTSGVTRICLDSAELQQASSVMARFGLDFDDAYQYVASSARNCTLVTFDKDFDKTDIEHRTPSELTSG